MLSFQRQEVTPAKAIYALLLIWRIDIEHLVRYRYAEMIIIQTHSAMIDATVCGMGVVCQFIIITINHTLSMPWG